MSELDPRWKDVRVEAAANASEFGPQELEELGYARFKLWLSVDYKGVMIWNQQSIHPDDVEDIYGKLEIQKYIWEHMIKTIDEGMDRVDAGEREF